VERKQNPAPRARRDGIRVGIVTSGIETPNQTFHPSSGCGRTREAPRGEEPVDVKPASGTAYGLFSKGSVDAMRALEMRKRAMAAGLFSGQPVDVKPASGAAAGLCSDQPVDVKPASGTAPGLFSKHTEPPSSGQAVVTLGDMFRNDPTATEDRIARVAGLPELRNGWDAAENLDDCAVGMGSPTAQAGPAGQATLPSSPTAQAGPGRRAVGSVATTATDTVPSPVCGGGGGASPVCGDGEGEPRSAWEKAAELDAEVAPVHSEPLFPVTVRFGDAEAEVEPRPLGVFPHKAVKQALRIGSKAVEHLCRASAPGIFLQVVFCGSVELDPAEKARLENGCHLYFCTFS